MSTSRIIDQTGLDIDLETAFAGTIVDIDTRGQIIHLVKKNERQHASDIEIYLVPEETDQLPISSTAMLYSMRSFRDAWNGAALMRIANSEE